MLIFGATRSSVIGRVDPRLRVLATAVFAVVVCLCTRATALATAGALALLTVALARVGIGRLLRSLRELNLFILVSAALLPLFVPGEAMVRLGGLAWTREGLERSVLIAVRANAVMIAVVGLLATMEAAHLGFALNGLGVPDKLTHVLLFMTRYIEVIHLEYHHLRDAMRLRGFRPSFNRHTFRTFGYLVGLLLLRSMNRAERILNAMKCRGFDGRLYVLAPFVVTAVDVLFAAAAAGGVFGLVAMEWIWPIP